MLEQEVENNPVALKYVQIISECLQGLVYTTQNMLELSRLRLGIVKVVNQLINLDMTIQEILEIFKNEAKFKKIKIQQQGNNF